jgi:hypothetical protein
MQVVMAAQGVMAAETMAKAVVSKWAPVDFADRGPERLSPD